MFFGNKSKIFDQLAAQSSLIVEAAQAFHFHSNPKELKKLCIQLDELEKRGDNLTHEIKEEAEKTFILPLDKEDVAELTNAMDDIIDNVEEACDRLNRYNLSADEAIDGFSFFVFEAAKQIHSGIIFLKENKIGSGDFAACYRTLHDIESKGDKLHRKALESMMKAKPGGFSADEVLFIIKMKEILQLLENTLDVCEDIAVMFETLRLKYK